MGWFLPERSQAELEQSNGGYFAMELDIPIEVRASKRARRLTLRLDSARRMAILTVPNGISKTAQKAFLTRHFAWLKSQVERLPEAHPFKDGLILPLRGENHRIEFCAKDLGRGVALLDSKESLDGLPVIRVFSDEDHAPRRLKDWLIKQARSDIAARVDVHAKRLGVSFTRISVRDQRTRWGSCSSSGALSFSWRLIFAPDHVLDYVAAHEVAHLLEMNHSARFWARVKETMPDYEPSKHWLNEHGSLLHALGVSA